MGPGSAEIIVDTNRWINLRKEHNHLMEKVVGRQNLAAGLKRVEFNKGDPGIDEIDGAGIATVSTQDIGSE